MIERLQEIMRGGSSTQQLAMFAGAVLLVLVVDWQYVYGPKAATLAQEKAEVETLRTEYNAKRAKSNAREDFAKAIPGVARLGEMFAGRRKLVAGDTVYIDWLPGTGTVISVNGRREHEDPIVAPEFFTALMKIWLGRNPADHQLKDALGRRDGAHQPGNREADLPDWHLQQVEPEGERQQFAFGQPALRNEIGAKANADRDLERTEADEHRLVECLHLGSLVAKVG